jgi:mRNA interferase HigB
MRRLREFWEIHPNAESALQSWYKIVEKAEWQTFAEVRKDFPSADQVKRLTVFNIAGNKYRLVVRIEFQQQRIYIRQVMTHAEYDKEKWKNDRWFQ